MPPGINFGLGVRRLLDAQQKFTRAGLPTYLRLKNFSPIQGQTWAQMGFRITPSIGATGTVDIVIDPQPSVVNMSLHNIGQSMGKLRLGAKRFLISSTFSDKIAKQYSLSNERQVWEGANVVGLVYDGLLHSIEDIQPEQAAGKTISWILICNANEVK